MKFTEFLLLPLGAECFVFRFGYWKVDIKKRRL